MKLRSCSGVALVVALSAITLLTVLTVAFFSKAILNRQVSATSTSQSKAEALSRTAAELLIGELRQEIVDPAHSEALTDPAGPTIYRPKQPAFLLPQSMGLDGTAPRTLRKVSAANTPLRPNGILSGSSINISSRSLNGRYLSFETWFGSEGPQLGSQTTLPTWLFLTRDNGVRTPAINQACDRSSEDYVIGRFACSIYDVSGLLDISTAGHPASWTASEIQNAKHTLIGADLTRIGVGADPLVAWRNASSRLNYPDYIKALEKGSGTVFQAGDELFLDRKDLIKAAQAGVAGLTLDAVRHLTTFSREKNAPSWGPSTPAGSSIPYADSSNNAASTNRFLPNVRVTADATIATYNADGTPFTYTVKAGEPLIRSRFPLERLAWLGPNGPQNGGNDAAVQACFGLKWLPSQDTVLSPGAFVWRYVGASGNTAQTSIKTLAQVAAEPTRREPDFFELLQAGILSGSLGVSGGGSASFPALAQQATVLQVLRIGACMVDQSDADSFPTVIEYNQSGYAWQACGVESLPYVNLHKTVTGADPANPSFSNSTSSLAVYQMIGLWNPGQTPGSVTRPDVRLRMKGGVSIVNNFSAGIPGSGYTYFNGPVFGNGYATTLNTTIQLANTAGAGVQGFTSPGLLTASDVTGSLSDPGSTGNGWTQTPAALSSSSLLAPNKQYVAYRLPDLFLKANQSPAPPGGWQGRSDWGYVQTSYSMGTPFQILLEFKTPSGSWIPYSFSHGINDPVTWQTNGTQWQTHFTSPPWTGTVPPLSDTYCKAPMYLTSDPRSIRFGMWQYSRNYGITGPERAPDALITALWPTAAQVTGSPYASTFSNYGYGGGGPAAADAVNLQSIFTGGYYPAYLCRNNTVNTLPKSSYVDRDNVRRMGDCGLYTSGNSAGNPWQNQADRPVVLNRPFRKVAEIGYTFRDLPWKSLDLFSAGSADAGLLDLFCISTNRSEVLAGKVNLNGAGPEVLTALLSQAGSDAMNGSSQIGEPAKLAEKMASLTAAAPLVNKADLVSQISAGLTSAEFANPAEEKTKQQREAFVRTLADVGQTRTWNLLIDVVAQSGHYPARAASLGQFIVEGEKRYWVHVAIDRYTGEVIDRRFEECHD